MTKTLADMAIKERADCVGRWALIESINLAVIVEVDETDTCVVIYPEWQSNTAVHLNEMVTPRYDLPRVWTPDGEPVPGEWEEGHVFVSYDEPDPWITKDTVSIEGLSEGGMSYYEEPPNGIEVKLDQFGEGEGKARRWVGEWEQDNER